MQMQNGYETVETIEQSEWERDRVGVISGCGAKHVQPVQSKIYARKSTVKLRITVTVDDNLYESLSKGSYTVQQPQ